MLVAVFLFTIVNISWSFYFFLTLWCFPYILPRVHGLWDAKILYFGSRIYIQYKYPYRTQYPVSIVAHMFFKKCCIPVPVPKTVSVQFRLCPFALLNEFCLLWRAVPSCLMWSIWLRVITEHSKEGRNP